MSLRNCVSAFVACIALFGCATQNVTKEGPNSSIALRQDCTAAEATALDLSAFSRHPEKYVGRCVHVQGLIAFRAIYPDLETLYTPQDRDSEIALYGENPPGPRDLWAVRAFADVVAFTFTCPRYWQMAEAEADAANAEAKREGRNEETLAFVAGECHYGSGPLLWVSRVVLDPTKSTRLTGQANARRFGDLDVALTNTADSSDARNVFDRFVQLERQGDEAALGLFLHEHAEEPDVTSPFGFLHELGFVPEERMFRSRENDAASGGFRFTGCVCKIRTCESQWPIKRMDTYSNSDWPYVCAFISRDDKYSPIVLRSD